MRFTPAPTGPGEHIELPNYFLKPHETAPTGPDKSGSKPRGESVYLFLEFTIYLSTKKLWVPITVLEVEVKTSASRTILAGTEALGTTQQTNLPAALGRRFGQTLRSHRRSKVPA